MNTTLQLRLRVWIAASLLAILSWVLIPLTPLDRTALSACVTAFSNASVSVDAENNLTGPWLAHQKQENQDHLSSVPVIISLQDDTTGLFQESPHSPIDIAVILSNLRRLGIENLSSATVLAWDKPDIISLAALDKTIESFDTCVLTAPLSRGASPEPIPTAFRAASISIDDAKGNTSPIPVVNRIPLPGIILHPKSLAGFQSIDSEAPSEAPYLMARWDDRIVFSSIVLATLQHLKLSIDDITVDLNASIRLGDKGVTFPIDEFGRLKMPNHYMTPNSFPAAATIDASMEAFPENFTSALFCDNRTNASQATLAFNQLAPAVVIDSLSQKIPALPISYSKPSATSELLILMSLAAFLFLVSGLPKSVQLLTLSGTCLALFAAQFLAMMQLQVWLPGFAALITTVPGWWLTFRKKASPLPQSRPDRLDFVRYSGKPKPKAN